MTSRRLARSFIVGAMGLALLWFYMTQYYASTRPSQPDISVARTYVLNVRGAIVYLTAYEHCVLNGLFYGAMAVMIIGGGVVRLVRRRERSSRVGSAK